jgi:hypothetical protein
MDEWSNPPEQEVAELLVVGGVGISSDSPAGWVDCNRPGANESNVGVGFQVIDLGAEAFWERDVVGILASDVGASGGSEASVEGCGQSAIRLIDADYSRIGERLNDRGRVVSRAIIDYDELKVAEALFQDAPDRISEELRIVVHAHHDRNERGT